MAAKRIIFVSQEISPYLSTTPYSKLGRELPQKMQQRKYEVRTFMPDFGDINERRNQLHEVIRLSGVSFSIGDNDHPLVVKVASMQPSRIQVYFIDNDDYFQRLDTDADSFGSNRPDNDQRIIFFARGTVETARKLRWETNVIHVSGWMSALVPLYLKRLYNEDMSFKDTTVVYSVLSQGEPAAMSADFLKFLEEEGIDKADLEKISALGNAKNLLHKIAMSYSDGVVFRGEADAELLNFCNENNIPILMLDNEDPHAEELEEFYQSLKK